MPCFRPCVVVKRKNRGCCAIPYGIAQSLICKMVLTRSNPLHSAQYCTITHQTSRISCCDTLSHHSHKKVIPEKSIPHNCRVLNLTLERVCMYDKCLKHRPARSTRKESYHARPTSRKSCTKFLFSYPSSFVVFVRSVRSLAYPISLVLFFSFWSGRVPPCPLGSLGAFGVGGVWGLFLTRVPKSVHDFDILHCSEWVCNPRFRAAGLQTRQEPPENLWTRT